MNEDDKEDKTIEDLMKDFNNQEKTQSNTVNVKHIFTPELLTNSIASITNIIARWSEIPEIKFSDADKEDLTNALEPFRDKLDILLKYLPYLPLGMFSIGYGMRVISGMKNKKEKKKIPEDYKPEPAKPEPAKPEPAKPEPAKPEPAKPEPEKNKGE